MGDIDIDWNVFRDGGDWEHYTVIVVFEERLSDFGEWNERVGEGGEV